MKHIIRQATPRDIDLISRILRKEDVAEVEAASGVHPADVLPVCSWPAWVWCIADEMDSRYVALFGVTDIDVTTGAPWMVATDELKKYPIQFVKFSRHVIKAWSQHYKLLTNCVDARNTLHIKWLQWAGFTFTKFHPEWGAAQLPFWQFEKRSKLCALQQPSQSPR